MAINLDNAQFRAFRALETTKLDDCVETIDALYRNYYRVEEALLALEKYGDDLDTKANCPLRNFASGLLITKARVTENQIVRLTNRQLADFVTTLCQAGDASGAATWRPVDLGQGGKSPARPCRGGVRTPPRARKYIAPPAISAHFPRHFHRPVVKSRTIAPPVPPHWQLATLEPATLPHWRHSPNPASPSLPRKHNDDERIRIFRETGLQGHRRAEGAWSLALRGTYHSLDGA